MGAQCNKLTTAELSWQLLFFLNPNCSSLLCNELPKIATKTDSKSLETVLDNVIPRYISNRDASPCLSFNKGTINMTQKCSFYSFSKLHLVAIWQVRLCSRIVTMKLVKTTQQPVNLFISDFSSWYWWGQYYLLNVIIMTQKCSFYSFSKFHVVAIWQVRLCSRIVTMKLVKTTQQPVNYR